MSYQDAARLSSNQGYYQCGSTGCCCRSPEEGGGGEIGVGAGVNHCQTRPIGGSRPLHVGLHQPNQICASRYSCLLSWGHPETLSTGFGTVVSIANVSCGVAGIGYCDSATAGWCEVVLYLVVHIGQTWEAKNTGVHT